MDRLESVIAIVKRRLSIIWMLAYVDLKLRYHNSWAGFVWSFVKPVLQFIVYYLVFGFFLKVGQGVDYALSIFLGILTWSFFAESTAIALTTLVEKKSIVTKVKVPNTSMPFSAYLMPLLNYLLGMSVFFLVYAGLASTPTYVLDLRNMVVIVASLAQLSLIILAFNLMLSYLYVYFRDVRHFWDILMIYGMLMSPVMYDPPIPERFAFAYYLFNVVAFPLKNLKSAFFASTPCLWHEPSLVLASGIGVCSLVVLALWVHTTLKFKVADYL